MVTEMSPAETCKMNHTERKRQLKEYSAGPAMSTAGTQTEQEVKRPCPMPQRSHAPASAPSNSGWGDLFRDRQTFVEMHLC